MRRILYGFLILLMCGGAAFAGLPTNPATVDPGGTGDYLSLSAWEAAITDNPMNADLVVNCISSDGSADTTAVTISFTMGTGSLTIQAGAGHGAGTEWSESKYRLVASTGVSLNVAVPKVRVKNIQIGGIDNNIFNINNTTGGNYYIERNLIKGNSTASKVGIWVSGVAAGTTLYIFNNIIYGQSGASATTIYIYDPDATAYIDNCTVANGSGGIYAREGTTTLTNTIVYGSGNAYSYIGTFNGNSDYNMTDSTDTTEGGANSIQEATITFENGYALQAGSDGIDVGNGAIINCSHTDDILGTTRTGTWDIGAFELESAVAPVAAFSGTPLSGDKPLEVTFTDASTNTPTSWAWDFGDLSCPAAAECNDQNPVHIYADAGTYTVTLTATNDAGSDDEIKEDYVTVSEPAPVAAFSADDTNVSAGTAVTFTDESTGEKTDWAWDFGDSTCPAAAECDDQSPIHTYSTPGTYTVSLIVYGPGGQDEEEKMDYITVTGGAILFRYYYQN